mmetsp:Transcript_110371/g.317435  ORF Transcript_110371/g.317435 Transcript_110371/m.317435 type:complete len:204 (-) Transcript_110371:1316-1927(-)
MASSRPARRRPQCFHWPCPKKWSPVPVAPPLIQTSACWPRGRRSKTSSDSGMQPPRATRKSSLAASRGHAGLPTDDTSPAGTVLCPIIRSTRRSRTCPCSIAVTSELKICTACGQAVRRCTLIGYGGKCLMSMAWVSARRPWPKLSTGSRRPIGWSWSTTNSRRMWRSTGFCLAACGRGSCSAPSAVGPCGVRRIGSWRRTSS